MGIDDDILEIKQHIGDAIENTMRTVILDVIKNSMERAIEDVVYSGYDPTQYVRREKDGGLIDPNNIAIENYDRNDEEHTMTVKNYRSDRGRDVAEIVNKGTGYTWKNSEIYQLQPYPRPFYAETEQILENEGDLDSFFDIALLGL